MSQDTAQPPALSPVLVVHPDPAQGTLRVRGRVDPVGADLLADRVVALQRLGHRQISVRVEPPADPEERDLLIGLADRVAAEGVRLVLE